MLGQDVRSEGADAVFRRKFREKLAARGYRGADLDCKTEELMNAPVRFRLDLGDETPDADLRQS